MKVKMVKTTTTSHIIWTPQTDPDTMTSSQPLECLQLFGTPLRSHFYKSTHNGCHRTQRQFASKWGSLNSKTFGMWKTHYHKCQAITKQDVISCKKHPSLTTSGLPSVLVPDNSVEKCSRCLWHCQFSWISQHYLKFSTLNQDLLCFNSSSLG